MRTRLLTFRPCTPFISDTYIYASHCQPCQTCRHCVSLATIMATKKINRSALKPKKFSQARINTRLGEYWELVDQLVSVLCVYSHISEAEANGDLKRRFDLAMRDLKASVVKINEFQDVRSSTYLAAIFSLQLGSIYSDVTKKKITEKESSEKIKYLIKSWAQSFKSDSKSVLVELLKTKEDIMNVNPDIDGNLPYRRGPAITADHVAAKVFGVPKRNVQDIRISIQPDFNQNLGVIHGVGFISNAKQSNKLDENQIFKVISYCLQAAKFPRTIVDKVEKVLVTYQE